jgi:PEP-CTERM motif
LVTFEVHGHVANALSQDFQVGDTTTVDFTFDSAAAGIPVMNDPFLDTQYSNIVSWALKSSAGYNFSATADTFLPDVGAISIGFDKVSQSYPTSTDRYIVNLSDVPQTVFPSGHTINFFQFDLLDNIPTGNPDLLSNGGLPMSPPPLGLASTATLALAYNGNEIPSQLFAVDSFTAVPEPTTLAYVVIGLGCLATAARRKFHS